MIRTARPLVGTDGHVTVVVPTRDRVQMLRWTLGSILAQRSVDFDVIVVNDGSTDQTAELLATIDDPRLTSIHNDAPTGSPAGARNVAIAVAAGPWVAFCDHDDLWAPDKLRRQIDAIAECAASGVDARWAIAGAIHVDNDLDVIGADRPPASGDILRSILGGNVVPGGGSGTLVEVALLREVGAFDASRPVMGAEDWELWTRLAERSPVASVDEPLVAYRVHAASVGHQGDLMKNAIAAVRSKHRALGEANSIAPWSSDDERFLGQLALRGGNSQRAARHITRAAVSDRRPRQMAYAAMVAVAPGTMQRRDIDAGRHDVPDAWRRSSTDWMRDIRPVGVDHGLVSVVIPTHNRAELLSATLDSVLAQRGVDLEVIVVDDGSSDSTAAWLESLDDSRVVVRHLTPASARPAVPRNVGIEAATGRWVAFCDDDDVWAPGKLMAQLDALDRFQSSDGSLARWSCVGAVHVDERLTVVGSIAPPPSGEVSAALAATNVIPGGGSGVLAELDLVRKVGGFDADPALASVEDWDLWMALAAHSPMANVDRPLLAYRISTSSVSKNIDRIVAAHRALATKHTNDSSMVDETSIARYVARQEVHSGDGRRAAVRLLSLWRRTGERRDLVAAGVAAISPRLYRAEQKRRVPASWRVRPSEWIGRRSP